MKIGRGVRFALTTFELNVQHSCSSLLQIPFLSIPKRRPHAQRHETERGKQKNNHAFADGSLPILGSRLSGAVTHGASLAEKRHSEQQKEHDKDGSTELQYTHSETMRRASGKKIIIIAKQATKTH